MGQTGLPARATGRLASKPSRAICCKPPGRAPKNLPARFPVEENNDRLKNANDRQKCQRSPQKTTMNQRSTTIARDRPTIDQRWTTIGPKESTQVQRSANANGTIFFSEMQPTDTQVPASGPAALCPRPMQKAASASSSPQGASNESIGLKPTEEQRGDQNARHDS